MNGAGKIILAWSFFHYKKKGTDPFLLGSEPSGLVGRFVGGEPSGLVGLFIGDECSCLYGTSDNPWK
jgi:hypothetical protein